MNKLDILKAPTHSKQNSGYAIYIKGKKVWESLSDFSLSSKIEIENLLTSLYFKLNLIEVTDEILQDNYGIFPDELEELSKYSKEEKFEKDKLEKVIPGEDYDFDTIFFPEIDLDVDDSKAYDSNYDLEDFENQEIVEWIDIEDFYEDDDDLDF